MAGNHHHTQARQAQRQLEFTTLHFSFIFSKSIWRLFSFSLGLALWLNPPLGWISSASLVKTTPASLICQKSPDISASEQRNPWLVNPPFRRSFMTQSIDLRGGGSTLPDVWQVVFFLRTRFMFWIILYLRRCRYISGWLNYHPS